MLEDKKQYVDIGTVGLCSGDWRKERERRRNTHTVIDSRDTCNSCHKKFYENKYGLHYICENCFEKKHNEKEIKIFNELTPLLYGIEQIDDNIFVINVDEEGMDYEELDKWRQNINYKILYEFNASDGIGNPLLEWVIKVA